ncbi:ribonuclease J [Candidatus Roizmanbacteria bacterium]|nr:ribonuclease J [Candidatus Roizmanbacteria bacterium]
MENFKVRFVPLGGVVGVTKNMYVYELYQGDVLQDILLVDCGIGFPQEKELGVDFVIPDISYLVDKVDKIRGLLLTHGHEDHIGAVPYLYDKLGKPQIFTSKLTAMFVANKVKEFAISPDITVVQYGKDYSFGGFQARFIPVTHSIPDTMHILIKTPAGSFYHGPDYKLDLTPPYGSPPDFYEIVKAGKDGLLCVMSDALGAERDGLTLSESIVGQTFEDEMRKTKGKFIMTTFSSNISRIRQCCEAAIKFNRSIIFLGRSMRENTRLSSEIGYLPIPESLMGKEEDAARLPPNKICLIVAGSQGQYDSALYKIARKQNKNIRIKSGDKVIFSSDPIPGNENEVYALIEELSLQGAEVIYSDIQEQLHASGHGSREDLKFLMRFTHPKYLLPIGGNIRHQREYQKLAVDLGYSKENVLLLNEGETMWFMKNDAEAGETVETKNIYVDAYGVGDVGNVVLRDRKTLSSEGMVVALIIVDGRGAMVARPRILSRGFVFEKNEDALYEDAAKLIEKTIRPNTERILDMTALKRETAKILENFFYEARGRRPLVVVDTIEV